MTSGTDQKLDLRGAIVPFTLLKVSEAFRGLRAGDTLEVLWNDPDTPGALFKVLPVSAYDVVSMDDVENGFPCYRLKLKKR